MAAAARWPEPVFLRRARGIDNLIPASRLGKGGGGPSRLLRSWIGPIRLDPVQPQARFPPSEQGPSRAALPRGIKAIGPNWPSGLEIAV